MVCLCANGNISIEREEMNAAREREGSIVMEQMKGDGLEHRLGPGLIPAHPGKREKPR